MTAVLEWGLTNAAMALILAVPAYASSRLRRPAITHALWLLVLLRLVAPPMWQVSLPGFASPPIESSTAIDLPNPEPPTFAQTGDEAVPDPITPESVVAAPHPSLLETPVKPALSAATTIPSWDWPTSVAIIWAAGAVVCVGLAVSRVWRFRRILKLTAPADEEWQQLAGPIAERIGLRGAPEIRLVPGAVAPLLWAGFGRPVLLIPAGLANRLDDERRAALIAHELAHLRRGDHFVRWLELAVTALYWWNPAAWLARRELREAEEQLCDAWVVWVLPDARRAYATALVDTVDFLSEARPVLPPLASGLGEVRNLERRVVMILRGHAPRQLTRFTMCVGLATALGLLTLSPGRADDDPPTPPTPPAFPKAPAPPAPPDGARGREKRAAPAGQVEEAEHIRQEIRRMREAMNRLENRLAEIEGRPAARGGGEGRGGEARGGTRARSGTPAPEGLPPTPPTPPQPGQPGAFGRFGGMNPPPGSPGGFGGGGGAGGFGGQGPNFERRMEEMQRAIEQLSRQMDEMRRTFGEQRRGPGPDGPGERRGPGRESPPQPRNERPRAAAGG